MSKLISKTTKIILMDACSDLSLFFLEGIYKYTLIYSYIYTYISSRINPYSLYYVLFSPDNVE